jgi:hypothetical protein
MDNLWGLAPPYQPDYGPGELTDMQCCGLREFSGVDEIESVEDVKKILAEARGDKAGFVIASAVYPSQRVGMNLLKKGGFKEIRRFTNPNTGNKVVVLGAPTQARLQRLA